MNEIKRVNVLQQVTEKKMSGTEAAQHLGLSVRQVRRLLTKYREEGAAGLAHGNRGRAANNRIEASVRTKILELAEQKYSDYHDCHLTEELNEQHGFKVSRSSVRRIRRAGGQKSPRKHRSPRHRSRRERKAKAGMLLQTDGSRHDWLEGRGPWLTLIAYIDDASNEVLAASFRDEEDAAGYFLGLQEVCLQWGLPAAIYADQHTIFQSPAKASPEQILSGEKPHSQYGRLLEELGIELIAARSPQAKGRIERLWETLQDRLVKELRQAGANQREQANQVLKNYLPKFNARFRLEAAQVETAFVPWPKEYAWEDYFCFKHTRTVTNDNTFSFDGHRLQIPPGTPARSYARKRVEVRQHLDGSLEVRYQKRNLVTFQPKDQEAVRVGRFSPAPGQTEEAKPVTGSPKAKKPKQPYVPKPAANHPWRQ